MKKAVSHPAEITVDSWINGDADIERAGDVTTHLAQRYQWKF